MVRRRLTSSVLRCSFCSRSQEETGRLIAGPDVCICDECVQICTDILQSEKELSPTPVELPPASPSSSSMQIVTCKLCGMPLPWEDALPISERGFLSQGAATKSRLPWHRKEKTGYERSAGQQNVAAPAARERRGAKQFLKEFVRWAVSQSNVEAVALVGSYARGTATDTSDVDLVILANQPGLYLYERTWTHAFGEVVNQRVEDYGKLISLRVRYADGLEVEYGLTDVSWAAVPLDEGTYEVISDGMKVLFERRPVLSTISAWKTAEQGPLSRSLVTRGLRLNIEPLSGQS